MSKVLVGLGAVMMASSVAAAQTDTLQGSGIRVRKDAYLTTTTTTVTTLDTVPGQTVTFSGGDIDTFAGWGDPQIINYVIVGDSMEVEIARLAETRASSAEVRDFARMLVNAHSAALAEDLEMNRDEDLARMAAANDNSLSRHMSAWNRLNGLSGSAFDRAFLQWVATKHQSAINAFRTLEPMARDDDLEKLLEERLPVLEQHLNRSREIAGTLGVTLSP